MKKVLFMMACVIMSGLMLQSCSQSDTKIRENVQKELNNKYSGQSLTTSVDKGTVTLNGTVDSNTLKTSIEKDVAGVKGVKSVTNNIMVRENRPMTQQSTTVNADTNMKSSLEEKLRTAGITGVKVETSNGEITLSGDLKRSDLSKVMQLANETNPKKVVNNINLN